MVDLVIVTNLEHAKKIQEIGGEVIVCEDPLPDIGKYYAEEEHGKKIVFYICSFDIDEPYEEAFKAAEMLYDDNYTFMVSGNFRKAGIDPKSYPHIQFLGYVTEDEYYNKLFKSSVVIDLTENDNCLLCGAYEAMSAEKPLVTSDTEALRKYFNRGTLFTKHEKNSIASSIKKAYQNRTFQREEIQAWKQYIVNIQKDRMSSINALLRDYL
jgi:glycosyltransferase involved in cell wall biosynthesis